MSGSMECEGSSSEQGWRKGPWTPAEDKLLSDYINLHGDGRWTSVAKFAGLKRSGKSCRLRWVNYLKPGLKKGNLTPQEEDIIIELHALWGNKWSTIARYLPGRTDNEIKNYWRTHFKIKPKPSQRQAMRRAEALGLKNQHHQKKEAILDEMDIKYIASSTSPDGNGEVMNNEKVRTASIQGNQHMVFAHPGPAIITNNNHQQSSSSPMISYYIDNQNIACNYSDTLTLDDLWGFWNLNDPHDCSAGQGNLYNDTKSVKNHTSTHSSVPGDRIIYTV